MRKGTTPVTLLALVLSACVAAETAEEDVKTARELRSHLEDEFIPFFLASAPDEVHGGYNVGMTREGRPRLNRPRDLVGQARHLYAFSIGVRRLKGDLGSRCREAARLGAKFLTEKMHDDGNGGFYERVSPKGDVADGSKRTYGQAFAIYALSEYARATGNEQARALAVRTHRIVRQKMWDTKFGGLFRRAATDWKVTDDKKKIDDHLHFIEAVFSLHELTGEARYREEIGQLCDFLLGTFFSGPRLAERELTHRDLSLPERERYHYDQAGHSMESAWFLMQAARLLKRDDLKRSALIIVDRVLDESFDRETGGIVHIGGDAFREWWVQCEAVAALALAYKETGSDRHRNAFRSAVSFTMGSYPNREVGGWYSRVSRTGKGRVGTRAGPYHVTQMLDFVSNLLETRR